MTLGGSVELNGDFAKIPIRKQTRAFYINTGMMAPSHAATYLNNIKKSMKADGLDNVYYENFFFAVPGDEPNRVEVFP